MNRERLLQEDYVNTAHGPWKILVICILLNLTNHKQVEPILDQLFSKWPSPRALADFQVDELIELQTMLKPTGLSTRKALNLVETSIAYLIDDQRYQGMYQLYGVSHYRGCGQYAQDAWKLFVLKKPCTPHDGPLMRYAISHNLYIFNGDVNETDKTERRDNQPLSHKSLGDSSIH